MRISSLIASLENVIVEKVAPATARGVKSLASGVASSVEKARAEQAAAQLAKLSSLDPREQAMIELRAEQIAIRNATVAALREELRKVKRS